VVAAAPDRPDGVDHMARRQVVALGDARLAGRAAADPLALLEQPRPGRAVDCAVDPAAAAQALIGGVDDRVDLLPSDVALDHHDAPGHGSAPALNACRR
jgi:hypothetical protein